MVSNLTKNSSAFLYDKYGLEVTQYSEPQRAYQYLKNIQVSCKKVYPKLFFYVEAYPHPLQYEIFLVTLMKM